MRTTTARVMALIAVLAGPAAAQDAPATPPADPAWTWSGALDARWLGNVAGGRRTGGVYNSLGTATLAGDLAAITDGAWAGGRLEVGALWIRGGSVSGQYAGDALVASNIDGFDSIKLYQAFFEQALRGDRGSWRLGASTADAEFLSSEYGATLANSGFGWPAFVSANVPGGGPVWPTAALGTRVEVRPGAGWAARVAAYDGDTTDDPDGGPLPAQHGVHWQLAARQGAFGIGEVERTFGGARTVVRAGAWMHTASFDDVRRDDAGDSYVISGEPARTHRGLWGAYAALARQVWTRRGQDGPAAGVWWRGGWTPPDRSTITWSFDTGVQWTGALARRPADVLSLGFVHAHVSPDLVASVRDDRESNGASAASLPDFEQVLELTYQARVHPRVVVGPDVQWVRHPGLSAVRADACVIGLRMVIE